VEVRSAVFDAEGKQFCNIHGVSWFVLKWKWAVYCKTR
jgi:hypothetical protein